MLNNLSNVIECSTNLYKVEFFLSLYKVLTKIHSNLNGIGHISPVHNIHLPKSNGVHKKN